MRIVFSLIVGLLPIVLVSCKPQSSLLDEVRKGREQQGAKYYTKIPPSTPIPPPPIPTSPPQSPETPPPPVSLPSSESPNGGTSGIVNETGDSLDATLPPTWSLCPGDPPEEFQLNDQNWIDSNFKPNKGSENFSKLYNGVVQFCASQLIGKRSFGILAYGENAFAGMAVPGRAIPSFAAGAIYGLGKIFVFGNSDLLFKFSGYSPKTFEDAPSVPAVSCNYSNQITYLKNVLIWLLGDSYKNLVASGGTPINFLSNADVSFHTDFKLNKYQISNFPSNININQYPLLIVDYKNFNDQLVIDLLDYIKRGGNVLVVVFPNYSTETEYLDKLIKPLGMGSNGIYSQSSDFNPPSLEDLKNSQFNLHSFYSLATLEQNGGDIFLIDKRKLEVSLFPPEDPAFSCKIVKDYKNVTLTFPIKKNDSLFKYDLLLFRNYYGRATPNEEPGIPSPNDINIFPGLVPLGTPLVERDFSFNLKFSTMSNYRENFVPKNWQATGLYAPPGQVITVEVINTDPNSLNDFRIVINSNTDNLTTINGGLNITRHPILTSYHKLKFGENKIRNQYGGLIILEGIKENNQDKIIELKIDGAVEAPWIKENTTDIELATMKNLSAPWGMIQGPRSVAVIPLNSFKQISSVGPIRDAWTYVHVLEDRLTGKYDSGNPFPEPGSSVDWAIPHKWPDGHTWHVIEEQTESGQAHAGNPVMYNNTGYDYATLMFINPTKILSDSWTLWHELGHNHQQQAWTTGLDQEVTTNILSAYMQDNGYKYLSPPGSPTPFRDEVRLGFKIAVNRLKGNYANIYQNSGPICGDPNNCPPGQEPNNNDPYRRLIFFMQLIRYTEKNQAPGGKKGYDIITDLYQRVRKYDQGFYDSIKNDDQKKTSNLYKELSDITKIDLTDFFSRWGRAVQSSDQSTVQGSGYYLPPSEKPIWKCDPYNPASDNPC